MYKTLFCSKLCLLFFIPVALYAEEPKVPENDIGISLSGGINLATMYGQGIVLIDDFYGKEATSFRNSGNGLLGITYQFHKLFAFQTGFGITGKGTKVLLAREYSDGVTTERFVMRSVTHLEIPLLLHLQLKKKKTDYMDGSGKLVFHLFAGVGFDLTASVKDNEYEKFTYDDVNNANSENGKNKIADVDLLKDKTYSDTLGNALHYSYNDFFRRADIAAIIGCSLEKRFDFAGIFLDFKYAQGLLNFHNLSRDALNELNQFENTQNPYLIPLHKNEAAHFRTFSFGAGIIIYLKAAQYHHHLMNSTFL